MEGGFQITLTLRMPEVEYSFARIATALEVIARRGYPIPQPGEFNFRVTREFQNGEIDMLTFVVILPEESTFDVVRRDVTVIRADSSSSVVTVDGKAAGETIEFTGQQGEVVGVSCVNVDDAGNVGPARTASFTLVDTIPPPEPGELGLRVTGETPDAT
jgi:hypothetical protein